MNIFTVCARDAAEHYGADALTVLSDWCDYNGHKLYVIADPVGARVAHTVDDDSAVIELYKEYHSVHPSWWKLLVPKVADSGFYLVWDLDLLPVYRIDHLSRYIDQGLFNICRESAITYYGFRSEQEWWKYNCGLFGWPHQYNRVMLELYDKHSSSIEAGWEQPHINRWLFGKAYNVLPDPFNISMPREVDSRNFFSSAINKHYTWGVLDPAGKAKLIAAHREEYFKRITE